MPPLAGASPTRTSKNSDPQHSQIDNLLAGYVYSHTPIACTELFTLDAYVQDRQHNAHFDPDMLTDEATSTG